jgi:hypothetical protein
MAFPSRFTFLTQRLNPLGNPRRAGREALDLLPALFAMEMRLVGIDEFLQFDAAPVQDRH